MSTTAVPTDEIREPRRLAVCGLGYPILTVLGFAAFPAPDGGDVSAAHDPAWLATHTGAVLAQGYVRAAAALAFVVLAVVVGRAVARASGAETLGRLAAVGGGLCGALLLGAQTVAIAAAIGSLGGTPASAIRGFDALNAALLSVSALPAVIMFATAGVVWIRSRAVPLWLAVLTLIGVPLGLVDAFDFAGGPLASLGILGLAYFLVWALAASIALSRADRTVARRRVPAAV